MMNIGKRFSSLKTTGLQCAFRNHQLPKVALYGSKRHFFSKIRTYAEQNKHYQNVSSFFSKWWVRHGLRAARIGFLTMLVFQAGYQRGVVAYSKDPEKFESEMMNYVLGPSTTATGYTIYNRNSEIHRRVDRVANKILISARKLCQIKVDEAQTNVNRLSILVLTDKKAKGELSDAEEELHEWQNASARIHGNWRTVVSDHNTANAFVTAFCPRRIFVYEGLMQSLEPTDDELAMILGHEISHVILGHMDEEVPSDALLLGFQLLIMSLVDPAGISTFIFDVYLNKFREYIRAGYSRLHEQEADDLGMQIAGKACFNVGLGVNVFKKLAELDGRTKTDWADTHPASIERYQKLTAASEQFKEHGGFMSECAEVQNDLMMSGFYKYFWK